MTLPTIQWEARLDRVVIWLLWITLAVGVFAVFIGDGPVASSYAATGLASIYVLISTVLPAHVSRRRLVGEGVVLGGSILTMTAVALTDDVMSPFLLLSLMPVLFSGVRGGFRAGISAAALSSGILASLVIPADEPAWLDLIRWSALLFLVAVTFGYARRLLTEEGFRSDALAAASAETTVRLERLDTAHRLLTRLAARASTAELNPIEVGIAALESVRGIVPFVAASISLSSESGLVSVARLGESTEESVQSAFPMEAGNRQVGILIIATNRELTDSQRDSIVAVLQPASLAFSNVLLLQKIAKTAVREERVRLARDLHDDIGPSLASLGLALDLAALQYPTEPGLGAHLQQLRNEVGRVVEDVRSTVTDLRASDEALPLRDVVFEVSRASEGAGPAVLFQVDERRPARPSIAKEVNAIVVEAIRNAIKHAGAAAIAIQGVVDFDQGVIEIRDDGRGFWIDNVADEHFGLIGMQERAAAFGAELQIDSNAGGTAVILRWGRK